MKELIEPEKVIEKIEKEKVDINLIKRKTNSKTFRGYLNGLIQKANNDKNHEIRVFLEEILRKFNKFYPQKIIKSEIEIIDGWKGKDIPEIFEGFENDFIIKEHIKDKESKAVTTTTHHIPKENVNKLFFWIKQWKQGESHKCYDFASIIGEKDWKEVWKKRTEVYFPKYYYCVKILEALGIIKYSGRGLITKY